MKREREPTLDDLAFRGRNKEYGAYVIRIRYPRRLAFSIFIGTIILLLFLAGPWFYYYLEPVPLIEGSEMYEVEYYDLSPPPDEANRLARALSRPEPEEPLAPEVKDTVIEEKIKPPDENKDENKDNEKAKEDSINKQGGSGLGTGVGNESGIAVAVDVLPRFPGGDESRLYFLRKNVRYPEAAMKAGIQGVVMVVFIVEPDGTITNVTVQKKLGGGCDEEAIRVTKDMPEWDPGKRNGRAVRVMVRMPIVFRLPGRMVPK